MLNRDAFLNPPSTYRPMPFWFWNSTVRPSEVEKQIQDFHAKGLGGFFIHARFGLETEYLSREWMDCVRTAVEVAGRLGLEVWLYDENGFPSGIGDLKVSCIPEYRPKFVTLTELSSDSHGLICGELPAGEHILAYIFLPEDPNVSQTDILPAIVDNTSLEYKAPDSRWKAAIFTQCTIEDPNNVVYGVDYLSAEAMRYFFDLALTPYEDAVGSYFGNTIKGIFTDEPTLLPWHHNGMWYCQREHVRLVPWNDAIAQDMATLHNLSVAEFLPHVFYDLDSATGHVRKLFQESTVNVYKRAFFQPYREWCDRHSLKLTGHMLLEEGLYYNTIFESNPYPTLSMFDIPGTDQLGDVTEHAYYDLLNAPREHTNITGRKLASSVAHMTGKNIVISESFGCSGWGLTPERAKLITDWQYSLGVNMLCPHANFYSIEGYRKYDAPPAHNYQPSWNYYKTFADYVGRISYALRQGVHKARVALYYPIKAFHEAYSPETDQGTARLISDCFDACCSVLPRLHLDYDLISDEILATASMSNGQLRISDETFDVLIAHSSAIRHCNRRILEEFIAGGCKVIILTTDSISQNLAGAAQIQTQDLPYPELTSALKTFFRHQIPADPLIEVLEGGPAEDIRVQIRDCGDKKIYFIVNIAEKHTRFKLWTSTLGQCRIWNPETGETLPAGTVAMEGYGVSVGLDLPASASTILVIDQAERPTPASAPDPAERELYVFPDQWTFNTLGANALPLTDWNLKIIPEAGSLTMAYTTGFECEYVPDKLDLMLDDIEYRSSLMGSMDITVTVNDQQFPNPEYGSYLDPGFKTLDIAGAIRQAKNEIMVSIKHSAWAGQPQFLNSQAYLLGGFACAKDAKILIKPYGAAMSGSWTEAGYPFYSGTAEYSQSFRIPKIPAKRRLILEVEDADDFIEALVDGKEAGVRLWRPFRVDITDFITNKRSLLTLRVSNSMTNFLMLSPKPSGLMGKVRILSVQ